MAEETPMLRSWGNVDVQIGGPGNNWLYLSSCAAMTGPEVPQGDFESRWCQNPNVAGAFVRSSKIRTEPDLITFDLTTKLNKINHLKRLNCPYGQRARYTQCGEREDPSNYDPIMLSYCNVGINSVSYDDLVVTSPGDNDEIMVTASASADNEYRIQRIAPGRIGSTSTLGDQAINDIEYCDSPACSGYCGTASDGCVTAFGVTDLDTTPYGWPGLVKMVKDVNTGVITLTNTPIIGLIGNAENVECSGKRIGVTSTSGGFAYNDDPNQSQNEWNIVSLTRAPSTNHNALFARTAREWWVGCVGGYILKSVDGGQNWSEVHSATLTTQTINAVYAYDAQLVVAAGNSGVMLKSTDGGQTWSDITSTGTVGSSNLRDIVIPPSRPKEIYVGTSTGRIYRSTNLGSTWARIAFDGDSVGTVDDIDFTGPCSGEIMYILHNDAGPRGRILRDLSGGAGGADVEIIMEVTQVFSAGVQLNALATCDANEVIAAGELSGGYPAFVRAS